MQSLNCWTIVALLGIGVLPGFALAELNPKQIEKLTGRSGTLDQAEKVFKVTDPRKGLKVKATGVTITPPLGLTSWAAFKDLGNQTMVMGDLVLTQGQVDQVMDAALENGLEVTALHNHFLWEEPRIMFMHIGGMGDQEKLASAVGKLFSKIQETAKNPAPPIRADIHPSKTKLNTKRIEELLGHSGEMNNGVFKMTIGRTTKMHGHEVGKAMGVNTWAAFAGTDQEAVVDGDFAMRGPEVQSVLQALRRSGISIVALHNHMIADRPQIFFLHYWAIGPAERLAKGLRSALDAQKD